MSAEVKELVKEPAKEPVKEPENLAELLKTEREELVAEKKRRVAEYVKDVRQCQQWMRLGHCRYMDLKHEDDVFMAMIYSSNVVISIYRQGSDSCRVVDHHLTILMRQHIECRFVKINYTKCPFLTRYLTVRSLPVILVVKNTELVDKMSDFPCFYNTDAFATNMLRRYLAANNVIKTKMDLAQLTLRRHRHRPTMPNMASLTGAVTDFDMD